MTLFWGRLFGFEKVQMHENWLVAATVASGVAVAVWLRARSRKVKFVSYSFSNLPANTLVVDSSHPTAMQLTHHMKGSVQKQLCLSLSDQADTSTGFILNVLANHPQLMDQFDKVSANHFDIDSFVAVWCVINPTLALRYRDLLVELAVIGDFRELELVSPMQHQALRLACWMNCEERQRFYEPFGSPIFSEDGEQGAHPKFDYFLTEFERVLSVVTVDDDGKLSGGEEVDQVLQSLSEIQHSQSHPELGLVVMYLAQPGHYYALFSQSRLHDIVVSVYPNNRYEVEQKYTTMVDLTSRLVMPRVDMTKLAQHLSKIEPGWRADRINDSGPILRLERDGHKVTKAERYGHPSHRPIFESKIPPQEFVRLVVSYFTFAYHQVQPGMHFEWAQLHEFNNQLDWTNWRP
ncbi:hypothetical protein BASA81_003254 [Batrachochytrium salamandrivorans]|nr:hypothetical protein BASA81_003254 [Batrachochytrium salamandrivorans]